MGLRTISKLKNLKNKRILLRVDFNVPIKGKKITDDTRIREALKTIKYLKTQGAKTIIMSHLGRPDGKVVKELRLDVVAKRLSNLLKLKVKKLDNITGPKVEKEIEKMKAGSIIMLENMRFEAGEEECDKNFTKKLAELGEIFVNDAFGTAHRRHASTAGLAEFLPAYSGFLIEKEIKALSPIINKKPHRPLTMIFGGAKIDTKIGIIKNFIDKADYFLIGGAIANTFLKAAGYNTGESLVENDKLEIAREIMLECEKKKVHLILPHDIVVADEVSEKAKTIDMPIEDIEGNMKILDIGKWSAEKFCSIIAKSKTVIWNGPLGLSELKPFQNGTKTVGNFLAKQKCVSIIGGGDTADTVKKLKISEKKFTHISTGGGACIEFLEGKELPGIAVLKS